MTSTQGDPKAEWPVCLKHGVPYFLHGTENARDKDCEAEYAVLRRDDDAMRIIEARDRLARRQR